MPLLKLSAETIAASRAIEPGVYVATVKKVEYKEASNKESNNYVVTFMIPSLGRPHLQFYNEEWLQIGMVQLVETLRGRPFDKGEEFELDTDKLLEQEVKIHIVHREDKQGNVRATIDRYEPAA
jgi:hypothetical protein